MPYQVKAGRVTAIVANEKEALEMVRRLNASSPDDEQASIRDIFGGDLDVATLKARLANE